MTAALDLSPELRARVEAIAARSSLTPAEVVADALENGHSLDWQERFMDKIAAGLADADRGDFATQADLDAVRKKYRPA